MVEPLEPTVACLVVEDLMFGTAGFPLLDPAAEEVRFVNDTIRFCGPISERLAAGAVEDGQAGQLPELLRELWDFR